MATQGGIWAARWGFRRASVAVGAAAPQMTAQRHRRNAPGPQTAVPGDGLEPSDEQLIEAVLDGDVEMYAQLVQRHQRAACQLAYSFVGNFEDAKELSQNAFVKAYQHLDRFQRRSKFPAA